MRLIMRSSSILRPSSCNCLRACTADAKALRYESPPGIDSHEDSLIVKTTSAGLSGLAWMHPSQHQGYSGEALVLLAQDFRHAELSHRWKSLCVRVSEGM